MKTAASPVSSAKLPGGAWRLPTGGRVDRRRPVRFSFDGRRLVGLAGDTLASALLANGIHLVARSFKYHRPRGMVTAGSEEPSKAARRAPRKPRPSSTPGNNGVNPPEKRPYTAGACPRCSL